MASPAEAAAPDTMPGAYSAASASGPPNDVTATPVNPHPLTGRAPEVRGRSALAPLIRVRKVVTGDVSSSCRRPWRPWARTREPGRIRPRPW